MSYTYTHYTEIAGIIRRHDDKVFCVDHAVEVLFDDDIEAFEQVDKGHDTSCVDKHGDSFKIIWDDSRFESGDPDNYYAEGLKCEHGHCDVVVLEPVDEEWEEEE